MRRRSLISVVPLGLVVGLASGCAEELGPVKGETTRVGGVVLEAVHPVGKGWVEFMPVEGTIGNLRSAPIGSDGRFEADRVAVGINAVGVVGAPIRVPGGRRRFDTLATPIRRLIRRGHPDVLTIDVFEEAIRQTGAGLADGKG